MFKHKEVRERLLFTLGILLIFKLGAAITVPGAQVVSESALQGNDIWSLMNLLGGGALEQFSIFALGVSPYITASIVIELLSMGVLPKLEELKNEGAKGRQKLQTATRALTILLAAVQGYGILVTMQNQNIIEPVTDVWTIIYIVAILIAGSSFIMWLADQITTKGIGNGVSMIIFAGIVSSVPTTFVTAFNALVGTQVNTGAGVLFQGILQFALYAICYLLIILFVTFIEKAERKIPIQYAGSATRSRSSSATYLPIKVNSAGVIPVIFASAVMTAPATIIAMIGLDNSNQIVYWLNQIFSMQTYWGIGLYLVMIFAFSFFYANMQVDPYKITEDFSKSGAYIPGIRPGKQTTTYISKVLNRLTFTGAWYLCIIAALPTLILIIWPTMNSTIAHSLGGTGLIILIGVAIETAVQIEGIMASKEYKGFI
jgi:preprotein translocase subunit SecY